MSQKQRTGLLAAAIVGGLLLASGCLVAALVMANRDKRTDPVSESAASFDPTAANRGELATVTGVVESAGVYGDSFFESARNAMKDGPTPDPKERLLAVKCRAKNGKSYVATCVFAEQKDRRDATLGAKAGDTVTIRGKILSVMAGEVILGDCQLVGKPRR